MVVALGACAGDENTQGQVDAIIEPDVLDALIGETGVASETSDDTAVASETSDDTAVASETSDDTAVATDTGEEVAAPECGNRVVAGDEACDDGDECTGDGCGECTFEPALALVELELDASVGWDLDDADGDGDEATGIDNRLASAAAMRGAMSLYVGQRVADGDLLLLGLLGDVASLSGDADARLALLAGEDVCPPTSPPAWLDRDAPIASVRRDPAAFVACAAETQLDDGDDVDNGILADPARLRFRADDITLALGALGAITIHDARVEGALDLAGDALRGLDDGRIGGVMRARELAAIDTSGLTPLCPTALHAALGLAGHIDQDAEGDGGVDFVLWTTSPGLPCITAPVVIAACCDEGDCAGGRIDGADCTSDPRIGDGFSLAFRVRANAVHVVGPADAACAP